jgi:hypothetical protein
VQVGNSIVIAGGQPEGHEVYSLFTSPQLSWTETTTAFKPKMPSAESQGAAAVGLILFVLGGKLVKGPVRNTSHRYELLVLICCRAYMNTQCI